jgi:hypothetical protein
MPVATPTEDPANAINTAVAGTQQAQALAQATVNSAALTAMPATPTPGPTIDYVTLSEDELAALIDKAVADAISATEQTTTAVTATTSDNTVTSDEVAYVYDYYYNADTYVQNAEELLNQYYSLYSDLAYEMIGELNTVGAELTQMNDTLTQISTSLDEISSTLSQGLAVAEETIGQLETAAQQAQANAQELQVQAQDLLSTLKADQQARLDAISQIQPDNVPTDRLTSLQTAFSFIDTAKGAMSDNKLSRDELTALAQLGANAQAGFQNSSGRGGLADGPDLTQFAGKFNEITTQFARGEMPQARGNVDAFERSLGSRPSPGAGGGLDLSGGGGPNLPGGGGPGKP